jgi:hypothetical protein
MLKGEGYSKRIGRAAAHPRSIASLKFFASVAKAQEKENNNSKTVKPQPLPLLIVSVDTFPQPSEETQWR